MCGIAGFVGTGSRSELERMATALRHRGPDDAGLFIENGVALAHTRLSIIDLSSAGHQPMFDDERTVGITFNGEIYNFKELREDLARQGCTFKSRSDTEVIIQLYKVYGELCFEKLSGMFAIALYDFTSHKLLLARDRMGEKPLYWSLADGSLTFASELGALMVSGRIRKELDLDALNTYLLFDCVPTPATILKNVYKLEPGTFLRFERGVVHKSVFWRPPSSLFDGDEAAAVSQLDRLVSESIAAELVSDAPLGIFLSGGIDSSTVAWYAARQSGRPVDTFSIGFQDANFDESEYAREVAAHLGTNHHEKIVTPHDALDVVPVIPEVFSEPVADASVIPTLLLSSFARERVKVSLGGDGGDELFAGYPTFHAEQAYDAYARLPKTMRMAGERIIASLPASDKNFSLTFNLKKFISSDKEQREHRHAEWLGSFPEHERLALAGEGLGSVVRHGNALQDIDRYIAEYTQADPRNRLLYTYLRSYLMDVVLAKVDRASMHHSLEVRAPFLDHRLVEFVFSLPYEMKYRHFQTKHLLKRLMADRLPDHILHRKKKGFGIPLSRWLKNELRELCDDLLSEETLGQHDLFNVRYVTKLKNDHFEGRTDNRKQLWNLMVFQMWYKKWML
ncbi:MAG: asparagine synthase (glutamine-hydrolyzing) [Candidatus Pacebacteria bacterium]|nr:asparagine synthase (glutamine-hydrolyzing) [Candidatus Paceibacterota bacterium]